MKMSRQARTPHHTGIAGTHRLPHFLAGRHFDVRFFLLIGDERRRGRGGAISSIYYIGRDIGRDELGS